jgi:predicted O-methyltransferase YrrM
MGIAGKLKKLLNRLLNPLNVKVETCTSDRHEAARLDRLVAAGHFDKPAFPVLEQFERCDPSSIFAEVSKQEARFAGFAASARDSRDFSLANHFCTTPDAEVLYAMVGISRPERIVEVGSGHSTRLFRHAIADFGLTTRLVSIDPSPRCEIDDYCDEVIRSKVEDVTDQRWFASLGPNDMLFIDSSHRIKAGNDVLRLCCSVVPALKPGVLIHFHDIFLPYEYPRQWVVDFGWQLSEQYLVHALLAGRREFEVLWPGHYLERTMLGFTERFRQWNGAHARSLWLRRL